MATKLVRQTMYQFGSTVNPASEVGEYGSGATGTPVYTGSITLMQSLGAWARGWAAETIANNRPFLEDMNAVDCVFGYQLPYLFQMGVPEYDTTGNTFYFLNSIVQSSGLLFQVINDNGGAGISATAPGSNAWWRQYTAPAPFIKVSERQSQNTGGGTPTTGSWIARVLNTTDVDTSGISILGGNSLTLPAGTYHVLAYGPFYQTEQTQLRLYDVTHSAVLLTSPTSYFGNTSSVGGLCQLSGYITLTSSSSLQVQYQQSVNGQTNGLGLPGNFGPEVYTVAEFTKIS